MLKNWFLRLHRWIALSFGLPLAVVILTGLVLSLEPIAQSVPDMRGLVTAERIDAILAEHDPDGAARGIVLRPYESRLTLAGLDRDIDLATGRAADGTGALSGLFATARSLHEHFVYRQDWVVTASTIAMLVIIAIGVALGLPRLRNTLGGWHKGIAWFGLPLLVLSPLTGLMLAFGITLAPDAASVRGPAPTLRQAVATVARDKDLSQLVWLRPRGGRMLVRLNEGGRFTVYAVTPAGLVGTPSNWPRLLHEGNFAGVWSGLMNLAISIAFTTLLATGLLIWARRRFRRRPAGARPAGDAMQGRAAA